MGYRTNHFKLRACHLVPVPYLYFYATNFHTVRMLKTSEIIKYVEVTQVLVLRIWDVYPGSGILIFLHPGYRIKQQEKENGKKFVDTLFF